MTQFLLLDSEGPMRGPWVPCNGYVGKVIVSGLGEGDSVEVIGLSAGIENGGIRIEKNGEDQIGVESRDFLKAVRHGNKGRVSVWVT